MSNESTKYHGIHRVPYDAYPVTLHRRETIIPRKDFEKLSETAVQSGYNTEIAASILSEVPRVEINVDDLKSALAKALANKPESSE